MEWISISAIISAIVVAVVTAVGVVFCKPLYDCFTATVEAIRDPQSLHGDADNLDQLLNEIRTMNPSEKRNEWIKEAENTISQVNQLRQQEGGSSSNHNDDRRSSCLCLCDDACSRCNLHRNIKKMIARGEIIKRPLLGRHPVEHIDHVPNIEDGSTADRKLKQVMDMLNNDDVWCIGVYGPGGVGKTTLGKALNSKMEAAKDMCPFKLVRFIELKPNDGHCEVQKAIAEKLKPNMGEGTEGQEAIARTPKDEIRNTLEEEKFLLILDNVWSDSIQFSSIGIPKGQKGSKIILTTRSRRVCIKLGAEEIKMECLRNEEAWRLFAEKVGEVVNNDEIKSLAEQVCEKCGGLPLALVIVGSAMQGKTQINEWESALTKMQSSISIDKSVELELSNSLKLSFDSLDDNLKSCFLYCSLYPVGLSIEKNELVQCWIAEQLIDEHLYYGVAYSEGLSFIEKLMELCLLEGGEAYEDDEGFQRVKMHDVVCYVARWIAKSEEKSAVFSGYGISKSSSFTLPKEVQKSSWISFVDNKEIALPKNVTIRPEATTLLLDGQSLRKVEVLTEFLKGFSKLRVLWMRNVWPFPASRLHLKELHALILIGCTIINEVPSAENLKILDLSYSQLLDKLPRGTEKFTNLKVLNLSYTNSSYTIDADAIRKLELLEVLDMSQSTYRWPMRKIKNYKSEDMATLQDLAALNCLKEVYLQLYDADGTYEECKWMERLRSFTLSYGCEATRGKREKSIYIKKEYYRTEGNGPKVGSFILRADILHLIDLGDLNHLFRKFSLMNQFNSKLKALDISWCNFTAGSSATPPEGNVILNLKELYLSRNLGSKTFSSIANTLGATFPKLRSLKIKDSVDAVFSTDDLRLKLPKLEKLEVWLPFGGEAAFWCGPREIQVIAPNLKILKLHDSQRLRSICSCESTNEEWRSLEILEVTDCPELKKLPNMPSIKEIRGSQGWWNQLEWDSEEIKLSMTERFRRL